MNASLGANEAFAEIASSDRASAFEAGFALCAARETAIAMYPDAIATARAFDDAPIRWAHATWTEDTARVTYFAEDGHAVASLDGAHLAPLDAATVATAVPIALDRSLYAIRWIEQRHDALGPLPRGRWLLFADGGGIAGALAAHLEASGASCVRIESAERFERVDTVTFRIPAASPDAMDRLVEAIASEGPIAGVIHAWALDAAAPREGDVMHDLGRACGSMLHVVQTMARRGLFAAGGPRIFTLTRGAHAIDAPERANATQRALLGLGAVVAVEHPEAWGASIDLDPSAPARPEALADELAHASHAETRVAYRGGRRLVARLAAEAPPQARAVTVRGDAMYLITGGVGALGLAIARWLVANGARHLVLTSRQGPRDDEARDAIAALARAGADVRVAKIDVADGAAMDSLVASLPLPLAGIVHSAGILRDGLLMNQRWAMLEEALAPKVLGAMHLARHARAADFFVVFSSVSGWLGTPGQAGYAAANAFLDGFAEARDGVTSIAWGAWAERGMAASLDARTQRQARERGMLSIAPDEGAALFGRLAAAARGAVAVVPVHWGMLARSTDARPALLDAIAGASSGPGEALPRGALRRLLEATPEKRRATILLEQLQDGLRRALGLASVGAIDPQRGFAELGVTSLVALEIRRRLEASLDLALPATLLLDYPTLAALRDFIHAALFAPSPPPHDEAPNAPALPPEATPDADEAAIAALDDAEVLARIARKFEKWVGTE